MSGKRLTAAPISIPAKAPEGTGARYIRAMKNWSLRFSAANPNLCFSLAQSPWFSSRRVSCLRRSGIG
jgi:hypothetical protein